MRALIFIVLLLAIPAHAQVYDLIRTIQYGGGFITNDSALGSPEVFTSTGTMEFVGNKVIRSFHTCEFSTCGDYTLTDEILGVIDNKMASIFGDSGELVTVHILSTTPTIILLQSDAQLKTYRVDEYKLRQ